MRHCEIRFNFKSPSITRYGVVRPPEIAQHVAHIAVCGYGIRMKLDHLYVERCCCFELSKRLQCVSQVFVYTFVIGVDLQRPPITRHGAIELTKALQNTPYLCFSIRKTRLQCDGRAVGAEGRLGVARSKVGIPRVEMGGSVIRLV